MGPMEFIGCALNSRALCAVPIINWKACTAKYVDETPSPGFLNSSSWQRPVTRVNSVESDVYETETIVEVLGPHLHFD